MIRRWGTILAVVVVLVPTVQGAVDTLRDTSDIEDCHLYSYENCDSERTGEDCKRFNSGGLTLLRVGSQVAKKHRSLFSVPGWDGTVPDSSKFLINCAYEDDSQDRKIFLYPLTKQIYEGSELSATVGDYPEPDSGATWNHAWLDVGDSDSLTWTTAGGDYTTAIACTTIVTDTGAYFSFDHFNRVLNYWDTSGQDYGFILINENALPANSALKRFRSTESSTGLSPLVVLYTTDSTEALSGRRRKIGLLND